MCGGFSGDRKGLPPQTQLQGAVGKPRLSDNHRSPAVFLQQRRRLFGDWAVRGRAGPPRHTPNCLLIVPPTSDVGTCPLSHEKWSGVSV